MVVENIWTVGEALELVDMGGQSMNDPMTTKLQIPPSTETMSMVNASPSRRAASRARVGPVDLAGKQIFEIGRKTRSSFLAGKEYL